MITQNTHGITQAQIRRVAKKAHDLATKPIDGITPDKAARIQVQAITAFSRLIDQVIALQGRSAASSPTAELIETGNPFEGLRIVNGARTGTDSERTA